VFITSDTHFHHKNIIKYTNRPYDSLEEMNEDLVRRWNACVGEDDVVLHLGDFGWKDEEHIAEIRKRLNGRIDLILGNHDIATAKMTACGLNCITSRRDECIEFRHGEHTILASHRPRDMLTWTPNDRRIRLVGHEHNNAPAFLKWWRTDDDEARPIMALNMSVEWWQYKPAHIDRVVELYGKFLDEST